MHTIKKLCNLLLDPLGLEVRKKQGSSRFSLEGVLEQLKRVETHPKTVVDVGAAYGEWTKTCSKIFSDATYLLIEPLHEYKNSIKKVTGQLAHAEIFEGLAGPTTGEQTLYVHQDLVGSSVKREQEPHNQKQCTERRVPLERLDDLCERLSLAPPIS